MLGRPKDDIVDITLPQVSRLIAAADKYQMPVKLADQCKAAYDNRMSKIWWSRRSKNYILEFIASVKIIYQTNPAAGLRGRAITTAQVDMNERQHEPDFLKMMRATPDFTFDVATKGLRQALWCNSCSACVSCTTQKPLVYGTTQSRKLWDWIDHGIPQDWKAFECKVCCSKGSCSEARPATGIED